MVVVVRKMHQGLLAKGRRVGARRLPLWIDETEEDQVEGQTLRVQTAQVPSCRRSIQVVGQGAVRMQEAHRSI